MARVGIIVLIWNGEKFLNNCLTAIEKTHYAKQDLFLILIDNASDDDSLEICKNFRNKHQDLNIEIIHNTKNLGFAAGNNVGLRRAKELELEYCITLNQDIQDVDSDWVEHLVWTLENNPKIACVQARIMRFPQKEIINSIGNKYHFLGFGYSAGNGSLYTPQKNSIQKVAYASGGALCLRMELVEKFGGFQEETFMYHDDLEIGFRYRLLGYDIVCNHDSVVFHEYEFIRSIKKYYWMERNRIWFLLEYYRIKTLLFIAPIFLIMELGLIFFAIKNGFFWAKIKSLIFFLIPWHWIKIYKRRKYIQRIRRITDKELLKWASAVIEDQEIKNWVLAYAVNPFMRIYFAIIKKFL